MPRIANSRRSSWPANPVGNVIIEFSSMANLPNRDVSIYFKVPPYVDLHTKGVLLKGKLHASDKILIGLDDVPDRVCAEVQGNACQEITSSRAFAPKGISHVRYARWMSIPGRDIIPTRTKALDEMDEVSEELIRKD